jgi:type VI secretion system secreted protein Hcp
LHEGVVPNGVHMSIDIFLKIDDVKGESLDATHRDEIELQSWHWSMSQRGSAHAGSGSGTGKVSVGDLAFTKYTDLSTPTLLKMCCAGKHFRAAVLIVRKAGKTPLEYVKLTMNDGVVSSMHFGEERSDDRMTETVTLNFASFSYEYRTQRADGTAGGVIPASWHIARNSAA